MSIEIRVPELGESVTQARLTSWLKREGESVSRGEVIAEIETDKTSVEIEAPEDGVLMKIHVAAGAESVAINDVLALLDNHRPALTDSALPEPAPRQDDPHPVAKPEPNGTSAGASYDQKRHTAETSPRPLDSAPAQSMPAVSHHDRDIAASPLARRMAYAAGIPLSTVRGTGSGGRITKEDVEQLLRPVAQPPAVSRRLVPSAQGVAPLPQDNAERYQLSSLSTVRRVSAERLTYSKQTIPHFYLSTDCAMDAVSRIRDELNARTTGDKLSFTAFTLRAAALALKKVPAANAMWADGAVRLYSDVDLAVAVNTPSGLMAPIVRSADEKSLAQINREVRALAGRARAGQLKPDDYSGGTCTVSNLGMFGVTSLYPIINPPQACILGVGAIEERPVVRDHAVVVGLVMTCTLSADHRALDGAVGAEFLAAFRGFVEDPWTLLL